MPGNRLTVSSPTAGRRSVGGQKMGFKHHIKSPLSKCRIPYTRLEELNKDRDELAWSLRQGADNIWTATYRWGRRKACAQTPTAQPTTPINNAAVIRLYSMWPCLRLSLQVKEPHAPTQRNALSSVIVAATDYEERERERERVCGYFAAMTPYDLPEQCAGLPWVGIQFISELLRRLHFGLFQHEGCGLARLSAPQMRRRFDFVLK